MTTPETLLAIQRLDSAIDLARLRLPKLDAVVASAQADAALRAWQQRTDALSAEIAGHEQAITAAEHATADLTKHLTRLDQQLKSVIVAREADALMAEIATLKAKRGEYDDQELAALDAIAEAETALGAHRSDYDGLRASAEHARTAADQARVESEADMAAKATERDALRAGLAADVLAMYDTMRGQHQGIAVAQLSGLQCGGCHLDLSRAEVDEIKQLDGNALPECPNCGRILVR
ncbi:MAG TPA: C4-type zinc ribbon domain-containing protein [Ilumatobacteraceae bacterium]|nr:C4-type zinc ribbon domain-containing protein [Ilumatobacteraceae bacterium]